MTNTIHIVVHIRALPNKVEEVKALLLSLIEPTCAEAGCISYQLMQSHADPAEFALVEEWQSPEAINAHMQSEHIDAAFSVAFQPGAELLAAPPDIRHYTLLK